MESLRYGRKQLYQEVVNFISGGAAVEYLDAQMVKNDHVLIATYVGVENQTTGYTTLIVGIKDGDTFHKRQQEGAPSADVVYWTARDILAREGQRISAQMAGNTSGDICIMEIQGYLLDQRCEPRPEVQMGG